MNHILQFVRSLFFLFALVLIASHQVQPLVGIGMGLSFIGLELLLKRCSLRSFTTVTLGLFVGYFMGKALSWIFLAIAEGAFATRFLDAHALETITTILFLGGIYLGTMMTLRSSDELHLTIPFVHFTSGAHKKKDLIIDVSVLSDTRMIDLAASGLLDHRLILPRFFVKELFVQAESGEETIRTKAKRALEVVKKLEQMPDLEMRYNDTDIPEMKDLTSKFIRLTRLLDGMILTSDLSRVQSSSLEGVRVINLHSLAQLLKPLMPTGEKIKIKIQRHGKELHQGVGYLEDGTMVVVNGGGDFINETIDAFVLSVKHTASGRMIFCNALDEQGCYQQAFDPDGNR